VGDLAAARDLVRVVDVGAVVEAVDDAVEVDVVEVDCVAAITASLEMDRTNGDRESPLSAWTGTRVVNALMSG
jgi:hypothetical protein